MTVTAPHGPTDRARDARLLSPGSRLVLLALVVVVALAAVGFRVRDHLERSAARKPLEAAGLAAEGSGRQIRTVPAAVAEKWSSDQGPARSVVARYAGPGNDLLEPAFYASFAAHGPGADPAAGECVFLAVQPRPTAFDPGRVVAIARSCYAPGSGTPESWAETAVGQ